MEVGRMRQRGFTLLEILAALEVFGFLLAGAGFWPAPGDDLEPSSLSGSRNELDCLTVLASAGGPLPGQRMRAVLLVRPDRRLGLRWQPSPRATLTGRRPPPAE